MIPGTDVLFVPGHDVKKQAKAAQLPTTLILDLEDSVPPDDKARAREVIRAFFASDTARPGSRLVRVNSLRSPYLLDDLGAIAGLPIGAVVIPKVEEPDVVRIVSELLSPGMGIDVYALLETARGVSRSSEIAAAGGRLRGLMFGHADLANDLGIRTERPLAGALGHARACVATAARGAGLVAYDTPYENFRDPDGLRAGSGVRAAVPLRELRPGLRGGRRSDRRRRLQAAREQEREGRRERRACFYDVVNSKRPVKTLQDLKGLKIRALGRTSEMAFKELGASTVSISASEIYTALASGVMDGVLISQVSIWDRKLYEVQKYLTLSHQMFVFLPVMVNAKFWDSLPADVRSGLDAIMKEVEMKQRAWALAEAENYVAKLKAGGMEVYVLPKAERDSWKKAVAPVYEAMAPQIGRELIQRAQDLR